MDDEMIELCALAACKELSSKYTKDGKYGNYTVVEDRTIADIDDVIKAIIKAMREPTDKMLLVGRDNYQHGSRFIYKAMIDSIIND